MREKKTEEMAERYARNILDGDWIFPGSQNLLSPTNLRGTLIRAYQALHEGRTPTDEELVAMARKLGR